MLECKPLSLGVLGSTTSNDNEIPRYHLTTGKIIQGNTNVYIDDNGNLGIGEEAPETLLELTSTAPYITLHNSTAEDIDGGRESKLLFKGHQSGNEESTLASVIVGHDGSSDDQKAYVAIGVNSGSDNDAPTEAMRIDSSQKVEFAKSLELVSTTTSTTGVIYKGADRFIHNFQHPTGDTAVPDGYNTFVGVNAGNFTMGSTATVTYHGSNNSAMGYYVLVNNTTGYSNSAIGYFALYANTTGYYNSAIGAYALRFNTTGYSNSAIGAYALYANTTGYSNSAMGYSALYNVKPTSGAITAFADYSGIVAGTVQATSVSHGLPVGATAGIAISGTTNYNGTYTVTYIDADSFYFTDTWVSNDATGWWGKDSEGRYNVGIGYQAGDNITTGSNNLIIGYNIDAPSATGDNQLNISDVIYGNLSTGNIGIGTTAPDKPLEINAATGGAVRLTYNDADGSATDYADLAVGEDGDLTITTVDSDGAAGHIALMPDGNVGINDAAPAEKLDVGGNTNVTGVYKVADTQVVGAQQAHITDADGTLAHATTTINAILAMLETHGLVASA